MWSFVSSFLIHTSAILLINVFFNRTPNWREMQKHSIPVEITKLSDITRGPQIGPVGLIDSTLPLAEVDQKIMPPSEGTLDVQAKTAESSIEEEQVEEKIVEKENIEKPENKENDANTTEKVLKPLSKKVEKKKMSSFLDDVLKKPVKSKKVKKGAKKGKKNLAKTSFINSVLGDEEGKGTKESGGAQELGELTASSLAALVEMIRPCWIMVSMPGAEKVTIRLDVFMSKEGYVESVKVLNPDYANPVYKTVANSATRALADKRCQPFKLPAAQYTLWKRMTVNFCPTDLL